MPDINLLTPNEWRTLREIRLSALSESPDAFLSTYEEESEYDELKWRTEFARGDWYVGMVKLESDDKPVSIAGITREPGTPAHQRFLEYVWVAPESRRQGVAFDMINEVLGRLKQSGVQTVFLWVIDGNDSAMRMYKRVGFFSCNRRQKLEEFPGRSWELMQVHLGMALRLLAAEQGFGDCQVTRVRDLDVAFAALDDVDRNIGEVTEDHAAVVGGYEGRVFGG